MTGKRFFANIVVLIIAAAVVFYVGWVQFSVGPSSCAVMYSKTGGILDKPIESGQFLWRWEKLLPTNVTLETFSLKSYVSNHQLSGTLPSAQLYSSMTDTPPDFSYSISLNVTLDVTAREVLDLAKSGDIHTQKDLDAYMSSASKLAAQRVADYLLSAKGRAYLVDKQTLTPDELLAVASSGGGFEGVTLTRVDVTSSKIPDVELYELLKSRYLEYQGELSEKIAKKSMEEALVRAEEDRTMKRLEQFGEMLSKYPQLESLSKDGGISVIIDALKSLN